MSATSTGKFHFIGGPLGDSLRKPVYKPYVGDELVGMGKKRKLQVEKPVIYYPKSIPKINKYDSLDLKVNLIPSLVNPIKAYVGKENFELSLKNTAALDNYGFERSAERGPFSPSRVSVSVIPDAKSGKKEEDKAKEKSTEAIPEKKKELIISKPSPTTPLKFERKSPKEDVGLSGGIIATTSIKTPTSERKTYLSALREGVTSPISPLKLSPIKSNQSVDYDPSASMMENLNKAIEHKMFRELGTPHPKSDNRNDDTLENISLSPEKEQYKGSPRSKQLEIKEQLGIHQQIPPLSPGETNLAEGIDIDDPIYIKQNLAPPHQSETNSLDKTFHVDDVVQIKGKGGYSLGNFFNSLQTGSNASPMEKVESLIFEANSSSQDLSQDFSIFSINAADRLYPIEGVRDQDKDLLKDIPKAIDGFYPRFFNNHQLKVLTSFIKNYEGRYQKLTKTR